jgi:hypothetical protein
MMYRFLIIAMACFALIFINCGKQEPLSPDIEVLSEETSLSKNPTHNFIPWTGWQRDFAPPHEIDPGNTWISDDGILHVVGKVSEDFLDTNNDSLTGNLTITYNYSLNLTTGNGNLSGKWSLDPDNDAYEGTWEGNSVIKFSNFVLSGHGHGKGTGDFKGLKLTVEFHETLPNASGVYDPIEESGYIIEKP